MILRFVERRAAPDDWYTDRSRLDGLAELAAPLGKADWAVDVVLVDDPAMARLNQEFRGSDGVTDVLSFSYLQESGPGAADLPAGTGHGRLDLWLDPVGGTPAGKGDRTVGEVVLAACFVARRCMENGWSPDHEVSLLVAHGIMHILGWDHADEEQTEAMRSVEEDLLAAVGLPHPLRERS